MLVDGDGGVVDREGQRQPAARGEHADDRVEQGLVPGVEARHERVRHRLDVAEQPGQLDVEPDHHLGNGGRISVILVRATFVASSMSRSSSPVAWK